MSTYPTPWKIEEAEFEEYWMPGKHYNAGPARAISNIEDARLISAAPELLEAAKAIMENLDGIVGEVTSGYHENLIAPLRAAITKATGGAA